MRASRPVRRAVMWDLTMRGEIWNFQVLLLDAPGCMMGRLAEGAGVMLWSRVIRDIMLDKQLWPGL